VRLRGWTAALTGAALGLALLAAPGTARVQEVLLPKQSAEKAKALLQQTIQALGGEKWLNVQDEVCTGRFGQFGHSGALNGYESFYDMIKFPDKDRTEFYKQRNIINVFDGDKGWVLDRGGVTEAAPSDVADYEGDLKKDLDHLLRFRLKEPGMIFRYAGPDIVELKEVDWVELVDNDGRTIRLAIAKLTHLPVQKQVITRDPTTNLRETETEYYSNWLQVDGLEVPFQVTRQRNGIKVYQAFYSGCKFNTGLSDSLFTKESLEERWQELKKKKKHFLIF
jgi:hypothetical protein